MRHLQVEFQPTCPKATCPKATCPKATCPKRELRSIVGRPSISPVSPVILPLLKAVPQPSHAANWDRLERLLCQFDDQIQHINQLAVEQETAVLKLIAILQQVDTGDFAQRKPAISVPLHRFGQSRKAVGQLMKFEAVQILSIALSLLEAIATLIIRTGAAVSLQIKTQLCRAAEQPSRSKHFRRMVSQQQSTYSPTYSPTPRSTHPSTHPSNELQPNSLEPEACREETAVFPAAQEAIVLTLGAALLRIGLDWLVQIYPGLWFATVLLMLLPAVVAVYWSNRSPQSGFLWGIRLTLILIGLLLGGRS